MNGHQRAAALARRRFHEWIDRRSTGLNGATTEEIAAKAAFERALRNLHNQQRLRRGERT